MFKNILKKYIYFFLLSKKVFKKPAQKKVLIFDSDDSEKIKKYLDKNNVEILDIRMAYVTNQRLNLYILIKCFLNFKFSVREYLREYVKAVNPKLLITLTDNYPQFYDLKKINKKIITIIIQKAFRSLNSSDILFRIKELRKKKEYFCDYLLMFNTETGKIFKSFLKGKIIPIGSFKSNSVPKKKKQKKTIKLLYISVFRPFPYQNQKEDFIFFKNLKSYCEKNNILLHVLGATQYKEEQNFYYKIFGSVLKKYIARFENRNPYKIVDSANIVLNIDSTLGYEAISRGNKVGFFSIRNKNFPNYSRQFGWPVKKNFGKGRFWTDENSYKELSRVLNFLRKRKDKTFKEMNNIMKFDEGNQIFLKLIKKLNV